MPIITHLSYLLFLKFNAAHHILIVHIFNEHRILPYKILIPKNILMWLSLRAEPFYFFSHVFKLSLDGVGTGAAGGDTA